MAAELGRVQIGELSRRVGVGQDTLRAWERRYGLLRPARSTGGFRLYSGDDERRVHDMRAALDRGLPAAEAARAVLRRTAPAAPADARAGLAAALAAFDERTAHALLDRLLDDHGPEVALREVIYPHLREVGEWWAAGRFDVGQEHFASNLLHGRLLALMRSSRAGDDGPRAVLACPPGERHSLGLAGFGLVLSRRGWRVVYLGADAPVTSIARSAAAADADAVVLSSVAAGRFAAVGEELRALGSRSRLLLAGPGAEPVAARRIGAAAIATDPVTAAEELAVSGRGATG
jgi:DNA-binding transcriptional MerR regulator/methylmalonyl-CoA mutase cobalamin-binding subunit